MWVGLRAERSRSCSEGTRPSARPEATRNAITPTARATPAPSSHSHGNGANILTPLVRSPLVTRDQPVSFQSICNDTRSSSRRPRTLRSFDPAVADKDPLEQGIEDPWYGGHTDFDTTWNLIRASLPGIVQHVRTQLERRDGQHHGSEGQRVRSIS